MSQSASTVIEFPQANFENTSLPHGWRWVRVGDISNLVNGDAYKPNEWSTSGVPIIRIQNLNDESKPFNYWSGSLHNRVRVKAGDVLLAWSGTPGTSFGTHLWQRCDGVLNQHIFRVDLKDGNVLPTWFVYATNHRLHILIDKAHGGVGLRHVTKGEVEKLEIPLPPINEQKRLVASLTEQMAAVERARAAAESQLKAAKSLYYSYLRFVFDSDEAQRWERKQLGDISIVGPDNGAFKKRHEFGTGVPIVNVLDLFRSLKVDLHKVERVKASLDEQSRYAIASGDLFFCRSSLKREGVGWCCYVEEVNEPAIFECHVMRVRLDPKSALPDFVAHYWRHPAVREEVISSAKTATMTTMNQGDLARVAIPLPTISEQRRLAAFLSEKLKETERIVSFIQSQLSEINKLPAALLRQAFTGRL